MSKVECHTIEVHKLPYDLEPVWNPALREWSHMINGVSPTMPYLEPFLLTI